MADEEQPQQHGRDVKLPTFWKARPEAWFVYAESKFRLKHVETEQEQSDHLLAALPEEVLAQVMDVIEDLPEDTPYTTLKERLLETHTLSNFEKLELLFKAAGRGEGGVLPLHVPPASASVTADPVRRGGAW